MLDSKTQHALQLYDAVVLDGSLSDNEPAGVDFMSIKI